MLVATFGPGSSLAGKTITFENEQFALEGSGPIRAAALLGYDRLGHLVWAYEGLKEWVESTAAAGQNDPVASSSAQQREETPVGQRNVSKAVALVSIIAAVVVCVVIFYALDNSNTPFYTGSGDTGSGGTSGTTSDSASYVSANGNIWTGVKLYYGENKAYAFEVLGGNDTVLGGAEVRVRYPDGTEEWKSRDSIAQSGIYWVRADDPALKAQAWDVYAQ